MGILLAFGCGAGIMFLKENMDTSIRGSKSVVMLLQSHPLASIPYIETETDKTKTYTRRTVAVAVLLGICVSGLAAVHYLKTPLDVLWYLALRRFGIDA
jgi:hypothetical protein